MNRFNNFKYNLLLKEKRESVCHSCSAETERSTSPEIGCTDFPRVHLGLNFLNFDLLLFNILAIFNPIFAMISSSNLP